MPATDSSARRLRIIHDDIATTARSVGRSPDEITLIAISKNQSIKKIMDLYANGVRDFGENYIQEALHKIASLPKDIRWHFTGHLQTNKIKYLRSNFAYLHSIASIQQIRQLARRIPANTTQKILIQVQIVPDPRKSGTPLCKLDEIVSLAGQTEKIALCGLMVMTPLDCPISECHQIYRKAKKTLEKLRNTGYFQAAHLSMGMSRDYKAAIAEGATMVRVGTQLFGERNGA